MKRIIQLLCLCMLLAGCTSSPKDDTPYGKLCDYYKQMKTLDTLDDVIGMEALGIESDSLDFSTSMIDLDSPGSISKGIIARTLHGDDPTQLYNLLKTGIHEDGSIYFKESQNYANYQVYCVYALYVLDAPELVKATDYLASMIHENGSFASSWDEELDITGWVVEALSLVDENKYQSIIDQADQYIKEHLEDDHYDGGYGGNANTQSSVLLGKLANKQDIPQEQIDYFYTFQLEDGSFFYPGAPDKTNAYATSEGAHFLGNYTNGNVYTKAKNTYEKKH